MDTRSRLKSLFDDMDADELVAAEVYLLNILRRRKPSFRNVPGWAELDRRADEFRRAVEQRWRDAATVTPASADGRGVISGLGGGGGTGFDFEGRAHGKLSFTYSDGSTTIEESLRFVDGYEIETTDRFRLSQDGTELLYKQAAKSGGREVTREEVFPCDANSQWMT